MPAGRRGHKIREYRRRIDAVLERERERRRPLGPPPPPISEEHAALRERIAEAHRTVYPPEDPEGIDLEKRIQEDFEIANVAAVLISLVRREEDLLAKHGVEWQPYDFSLIRVDPPDD
jgi:hypothetical protein